MNYFNLCNDVEKLELMRQPVTKKNKNEWYKKKCSWVPAGLFFFILSVEFIPNSMSYSLRWFKQGYLNTYFNPFVKNSLLHSVGQHSQHKCSLPQEETSQINANIQSTRPFIWTPNKNYKYWMMISVCTSFICILVYLVVGYNIKHLDDLWSGLDIFLWDAKRMWRSQRVLLKCSMEFVHDVHFSLGENITLFIHQKCKAKRLTEMKTNIPSLPSKNWQIIHCGHPVHNSELTTLNVGSTSSSAKVDM